MNTFITTIKNMLSQAYHSLPSGRAGGGGLLFLSLFLFTSCNDWLDVSPKSQVEDTDLFSNQNGYKEALAGVYSAMVNESTYSKNMLFGTMDVLAHVWDYCPASYESMLDYDYTASAAESLISGIWTRNYNAIVNANNLLAHIDGDKNLFTGNNYSIIKGEALALRAFLHFDLLRCFGVSFAQNPSMPSIPYYTEMTHQVAPQLNVQDVANKVIDDLKAAEELLKCDPILTGEEITELNDFGYLMNRQVHLNYYAVKGLQARVYMWMGKYNEARDAAMVVLNSNVFNWANKDDLSGGRDYGMANEQVFALNNINLSSISDNYFDDEVQTNSFTVSPAVLLSYYDDTTDYRYLYLFARNTTGDWTYLLKYFVSTGDSFYTNKLPLIRIGELQLIKSECDYRIGGSGLAALNELREARGLQPYQDEPLDFMDELAREYRRELIGEGQLFFFYKRLNLQAITGSDANMVASKAYTFPLPKSETEASNRQDNR